MGTFTIKDEIHCSVERFWEMFLDVELQKSIYVELGFPKWELVEQRDTDAEILWTIKAVPKLDAPAAVKKVFGDGFGYAEEGRFDKASKAYRFVIKTSVLPDKLHTSGKVTAEPKGDRCIRVVEITTEAKIFGLGGVIDKLTEKTMREGWAKSARTFNAVLAKQP